MISDSLHIDAKINIQLFVVHFRQRRNQGGPNGQLPISFGHLPIEIFINQFLPIENLLFQNCLLFLNEIVIVFFSPV
jgi:hypothetical protein